MSQQQRELPIQRPDGSWSMPGNDDYAALKAQNFRGKLKHPETHAEFIDQQMRAQAARDGVGDVSRWPVSGKDTAHKAE